MAFCIGGWGIQTLNLADVVPGEAPKTGQPAALHVRIRESGLLGFVR
jgi:hypothetical protein